MTVHRYLVGLPRDTDADALAQLVGLLARAAAAKRTAVILGVTATNNLTALWVECPDRLATSTQSALATGLPGVALKRINPTTSAEDFSLLAELRASSSNRPLSVTGATAPGW